MHVQETILNKTIKFKKKTIYHLHAIVISVLSYICWVHGATDFHRYVSKIIMERAQWAPHLNPPLKSEYEFATHHVLWDKSELFFNNWELRYRLWKRFRLKNKYKKEF